MPVCVSCTAPAPYLYTTYRTKSNIRLGVCSKCGQFLDPLIEHPDLVILLDLILLKPRVYLHLLYNRGTLPQDATTHSTAENASTATKASGRSRRRVLREDLVRLLGVMIIAESLLRWLPTLRGTKGDALNVAALGEFGRISGITMADIGIQLAVSTVLCLGVLWWHGWFPARDRADGVKDGRKSNFIPLVIPLTVLYTSILPVLLQLFLSIWYTPTSLPSNASYTLPNISQSIHPALLRHVPDSAIETLYAILVDLVETWSRIDKVWAGTRLLGGMSAGFGLRIVLPTRPWETMGIILGGWVAGTWVRELLENA